MTKENPKAEQTREVLARMLGRPVESLDREPESRLRVNVYTGTGSLAGARKRKVGDWRVEHSTFHFLAQCLEFDPELDRRLQAYLKAHEKKLGPVECMEEFPRHLRREGLKVTGRDGDAEIEESLADTNYGESFLTTEYCYIYFEIGGQGCAAVAIMHSNTRIGDPRAFKVGDECPAITDYDRAVIFNVEPESAKEFKRRQPPLAGMECVDAARQRVMWIAEGGEAFRFAPDGSDVKGVADFSEYGWTLDPALRGQNLVYYDEAAGKAYCPVTGWELDCYYY